LLTQSSKGKARRGLVVVLGSIVTPLLTGILTYGDKPSLLAFSIFVILHTLMMAILMEMRLFGVSSATTIVKAVSSTAIALLHTMLVLGILAGCGRLGDGIHSNIGNGQVCWYGSSMVVMAAAAQYTVFAFANMAFMIVMADPRDWLLDWWRFT
jgi:hypothetical protein